MELTETIKPYVNELDPDKVRVFRFCEENEHIYLVVNDEDQLEGSLEGLR